MKRLRKCEFSKMYKTEKNTGWFHKWGKFTELHDGKKLSYTVGIIEDIHGNVHLAFPSAIKFMEG